MSPQRTGVFFIRLLSSTTSSTTSGEVSLVETISTCPIAQKQESQLGMPGPPETIRVGGKKEENVLTKRMAGTGLK